MYLEAVFSFYVLLYHFVGHSFFRLIAFGSFSDIIKRNFSLTLTKLNFYIDISVWLFVGKQYYRLDVIIIDEASQADIFSLAILYMGKKLIVVGDDKQVKKKQRQKKAK